MMMWCVCKVVLCLLRVMMMMMWCGVVVVVCGKKKGFLFGEVENLSCEGEGMKGDDEDVKSV